MEIEYRKPDWFSKTFDPATVSQSTLEIWLREASDCEQYNRRVYTEACADFAKQAEKMLHLHGRRGKLYHSFRKKETPPVPPDLMLTCQQITREIDRAAARPLTGLSPCHDLI